jgi:hypothetical protein
MIRTLTALSAVVALSALVSPAFASESVRIDLAGKPTAAVYNEITTAARAVCRSEAFATSHALGLGVSLSSDTAAQCVKATVAATIAKVSSPALTQYASSPEARLQLASID